MVCISSFDDGGTEAVFRYKLVIVLRQPYLVHLAGFTQPLKSGTAFTRFAKAAPLQELFRSASGISGIRFAFGKSFCKCIC
jgi:hypothetical protein